MTHQPKLERIQAVVGTRTHGGRVTVIRRQRWRLICTCGSDLGSGLDWIDTKRHWREHAASTTTTATAVVSEKSP